MRIFPTFLLAFTFFPFIVLSQGQLSGNLQFNSNFYDDDRQIGTNTVHYEKQLSSAEGWLSLNYRVKGFEIRTRFDAFHNSPVFNPQEAYTKQGLGFYSLSKDINNLNVTGGFFYEQFGSGLVFRAYEDRLLGIDNAVQGIRLKYDISDEFRLTAFTGRQKERFSPFEPIVKGANVEKDFLINDSLQIFSGASFVNRTLDDQTMNNIADEIRNYPNFDNRFIPKYNVYAFSLYNEINYKDLTWYLEYADKSQEAIRNPAGDQFINKDGYALYSTIDFSKPGFGISLQYRKNRTFVLKSTPYAEQFRGRMNFMPPIAKQHNRRLTGRYAPQTRPIGEEGYQADFKYSPSLGNTFNLNLSYIQNGADKRIFSAPVVGFQRLINEEEIRNPANKLYREINFNYFRRWDRDLKTTIGLQTVNYDRRVYQGKPNANMVNTVTPFTEITYKLSRTTSLRTELQYLKTDEDQGDFFFGLLELSLAPHFTFTVTDMINTEPRQNGELLPDQSPIHYYSGLVTYTRNQTRFTLGYVKRVQGIVCTGGVCRVEPAFSGAQFGVTTNF